MAGPLMLHPGDWLDPDASGGLRGWVRDVVLPPVLFIVVPLLALWLALGPLSAFLGLR